MKKQIVIIILLFGLGLAFAKPDKIEVVPDFVRAMPPSSETTAAYLTIRNHGDQSVSLLSADSKLGKVMLHTMAEENGVTKMRHLDELLVPAKGDVKLQAGGHHLMIFGIKKMPKRGEKVEITLHFSNQQQKQVMLDVK